MLQFNPFNTILSIAEVSYFAIWAIQQMVYCDIFFPKDIFDMFVNYKGDFVAYQSSITPVLIVQEKYLTAQDLKKKR